MCKLRVGAYSKFGQYNNTRKNVPLQTYISYVVMISQNSYCNLRKEHHSKLQPIIIIKYLPWYIVCLTWVMREFSYTGWSFLYQINDYSDKISELNLDSISFYFECWNISNTHLRYEEEPDDFELHWRWMIFSFRLFLKVIPYSW